MSVSPSVFDFFIILIILIFFTHNYRFVPVLGLTKKRKKKPKRRKKAKNYSITTSLSEHEKLSKIR